MAQNAPLTALPQMFVSQLFISGTLLTMTGQAEFGGFFKLASGMVAKQAEKAMKKDFEALKKLLEG